MTVPNAFASCSIFKGDITNEDFLHLVRESDGSVLGWFDQNGVAQGTLSQPGPQGPTGATGAAGTSNVPWVDIQNYGTAPRANTIVGETTTATTVSGSPDVTIGAAKHFANGNGVCIWKAGAACSISGTPSAPTITSPFVQGSQTITYQIVGYDSMGGLTAASSAGTVTDAPAIFGAPAVAISSITASAGVVTVNFASALNNSVAAGMTIHINGVTGSGATWNGIFTIASAPTTSQITYDLSGATGTGTVTNATGRVSNVALITAISLASTGIITITAANNFAAASGNNPTIVIVENCAPASLNGHYKILTANSTTITCQSATHGETLTGSVTAPGAYPSTATVYEANVVACPALSGNTLGYYIYSDGANPGGTLELVGKTPYGECHWTDMGPSVGGGFSAPAYVPTTPPVAAQHQMFTSTILSGGGTTSLVLANNVHTSINSLGATIMYDDGPCLVAALAAVYHGEVFLSPPQSVSSTEIPYYIFNSPISIGSFQNVKFGCACIINETITLVEYTCLTADPACNYTSAPQFARQAGPNISGLGNPMFLGWDEPASACYGINIDGLTFVNSSWNGQIMVELFGSTYCSVTDCNFSANNYATTVGLMLNGDTATFYGHNNSWSGYSVYSNNMLAGQSCFGPCIGMVWLHSSDNSTQDGFPPNQITIDGQIMSGGRGILFDGKYYTTQSCTNTNIGGTWWNQAATTPALMFWGMNASNITLEGVVNDSESIACLANWSAQLYDVTVKNCSAGGVNGSVVTGNTITGLRLIGETGGSYLGQNINIIADQTGNAGIGGAAQVASSSTLIEQPVNLGANGVIFSPFTPPTPTISATGSGSSFTTGTAYAYLTVVGLEGGESAPGASASCSVTSGNDITVGWALPAGCKGINVYLNVDGQYKLQNSSPYTTSSATYTLLTNNGGSPAIDGTGIPLINDSGIITQQLILSVGGAPASASAAGKAGQIAWDATHIYVCVATNTWVRATLAGGF